MGLSLGLNLDLDSKIQEAQEHMSPEETRIIYCPLKALVLLLQTRVIFTPFLYEDLQFSLATNGFLGQPHVFSHNAEMPIPPPPNKLNSIKDYYESMTVTDL